MSFAYIASLYPYESETRETKSLNGLWNFKISSRYDPNEGFTKHWYTSNFEEVRYNISRNYL